MTVHYVSNNGSVIEIESLSKHELVARQFIVDHKGCKIRKVTEFSWTSKQKVELLKSSEVTETLTSRRIPVVLVAVGKHSKTDPEVTCYILCVQPKTSKFIALRKFTVQSRNLLGVDLNNQELHVKLVDGPSLLILHCNKLVMCYHENQCTLQDFSHTLVYSGTREPVCCDDGSRVSLNEAEISCVKHVQGRWLIFSLLHTTENCSQHKSRKSKVLVVTQFCHKKFSDLDDRLFIPQEYSEAITCILIQDVTIGEHLETTSKLFVGTLNGFVLHLENGRLKRCIALNDSRDISATSCAITDIYCSSSEFSDLESHLLISQEGSLTVLDSELKVVEKFSRSKHIFAGDFVGNGTTQYLLLKDDVSETTEWILTDLDTLYICSSEVQSTRSQTDIESNKKTAVEALQTRLQREKMILHDEQQLHHQRTEFLREMFSRQTLLLQSSDLPPTQHKVDLIPLIAGRTNYVCQGRQTATPESTIKTCAIWQRTYGNKWCIAADIVNSSDRDVYVWLQVVPATESGLKFSATSRSKPATCMSKPETSSSPFSLETAIQEPPLFSEAKRMKTMDEFLFRSSSSGSNSAVKFGQLRNSETILCVTALPNFGTSSCHAMFVLVHWRHVLSDTCTRETSDPNTEPQTAQQTTQQEVDSDMTHTVYCGKVTLSCTDVVEGTHELKFSGHPESDNVNMEELKEWRRNKEAWQQLQTVLHVTVRSSPGILAHLPTLLIERCRFVYNSRYDCYVTEVSALDRVQIQLGSQTSDDAKELDVYYSCQKDLFLSIHHLYSRLPDHVIILPQDVTSSHILHTVLPSMHRETHFLSQGIRKLLNDHHAQKASGGVDEEMGDGEDIRKVGEKFKRKKEKLLVKQKDTISRESVETFSRQVAQLRKKTDLKLALSGDL